MTCTANKHDTYSAYQKHGCRCPTAREARRLYGKRRRENRQAPALVDATGTRRRLEALAAIGWPMYVLGNRIGVHPNSVQALGNGRRVLRATADQIASVYEQLCMTPGPSNRLRRKARGWGWAPPLAWDEGTIDDPAATPQIDDSAPVTVVDEVRLLRAVRGQLPVGQLNQPERETVVARLHAAGLSNPAIATRTRMNLRTIERISRGNRA